MVGSRNPTTPEDLTPGVHASGVVVGRAVTVVDVSVCEKRGWTQSALLFNGLGTSWSDLSKAARGAAMSGAVTQGALDFDTEGG